MGASGGEGGRWLEKLKGEDQWEGMGCGEALVGR